MLQMARFWPRVAYRFPIIRLAAVRARGERRPPDGLRLCLAAAEPRARPLCLFVAVPAIGACHLPRRAAHSTRAISDLPRPVS